MIPWVHSSDSLDAVTRSVRRCSLRCPVGRVESGTGRTGAGDSDEETKCQERPCARRFASAVPEPVDSLRDRAAAGAIGPGAVAPSERVLSAGAGDLTSTIQKRHSRSSTRRLNPAGPTIGKSSPAGGRTYWVHAWIEWSVECHLGQTQPRVSVHRPARSECESGTASAIQPGSAIRGGVRTRNAVRAVCEGHLGTHLIARISKARSRIGRRFLAITLNAPESCRLCRGCLAG